MRSDELKFNGSLAWRPTKVMPKALADYVILRVQVAAKVSQDTEQSAADAGSRLQQALEHVASLTEQVHARRDLPACTNSLKNPLCQAGVQSLPTAAASLARDET